MPEHNTSADPQGAWDKATVQKEAAEKATASKQAHNPASDAALRAQDQAGKERQARLDEANKRGPGDYPAKPAHTPKYP